MLKSSLKKLNRCLTSRRSLSNYNNNNNNNNALNVKFCPSCSESPSLKPTSWSAASLQRGFRTSLYSCSSRSRSTSPLSSISSPPPPTSTSQPSSNKSKNQQLKIMEMHHEIRISIISLINEFADREIPDISLNDMLIFKDFNDENLQLDNMISLIENSNRTLYTLLVLNCKRLKEFKNLPYICILNPNISTIFNTYIQSLEKLMQFINENHPNQDNALASFEDENEELNIFEFYENFKIGDLETNAKFIDVLGQILEIHSDNLPILSDGFKEISQLHLIEDDQYFLNSHLKERIMFRLIMKHHMSLTEHYLEYCQKSFSLSEINTIGLINKDLDVVNLIRQVAEFVNDMSSLKYDEKISLAFETIILTKNSTTTDVAKFPLTESQDHQLIFPYISSHLEYVLQEILKNSSRAQIENKVKKPIQITIVLNKRSPESYLEIRVRDQGKGITKLSMQKLFTYSFTTVKKTSTDENDNYDIFNSGAGTDANIIAGLGYGLPLSKLYVEMFGGDLQVQTYEGWGTDVYIKLRGPQSELLQ